MAWTPDPNLFAKSLGAGIQTGSQLAQLVQDRRDRRTLSELEKLMQQGQYEQVGAGLVGMGQVGQGVNVANIPYMREHQRLQQEFQNQEAQRQAAQQAFQNQFAMMGFSADQDWRGRQFGLETEKLRAAKDAAAAEAAAPRFDDELKIAKDFQAVTSDFRAVRDAYQRILASTESPSPAGDMALIFNYMKALDPGSVVRESEFALAAQSGNLPTQVQAAYERIATGKRLTDEQRKDFLETSERLFRAAERQYNSTAEVYRQSAQDYGLSPERVVKDFGFIGPDRDYNPSAMFGDIGQRATNLARPAVVVPQAPKPQSDPEIDDLVRQYGG